MPEYVITREITSIERFRLTAPTRQQAEERVDHGTADPQDTSVTATGRPRVRLHPRWISLSRIVGQVAVLGIPARVEAHDGVAVLRAGGETSAAIAVAGPGEVALDGSAWASLAELQVGALAGRSDQEPSHCGAARIYDEAQVAHLLAARTRLPAQLGLPDATVEAIAEGRVRSGWRMEGRTRLDAELLVTRYVHEDGQIVDDNTRNQPEGLLDEPEVADDTNYVGHRGDGAWEQFPTLHEAMVFAEGC